MSFFRQIGLFIVLSVFISMSSQALAAKITVGDSEYYDKVRDRTIPYRLYAPDPVPSPAPVVIYTHNLGGSVEEALYLTEGLAAKGYLVFALQHPGSDLNVWANMDSPNHMKHALRLALKNPANGVYRYDDVYGFINYLEKLNGPEGALSGLMDLNKIAIAGHGQGARAALTMIGEKDIDGTAPYYDPRIKAAILLSPALPNGYFDRPEDELNALYSSVIIPTLHITGTEDDDPFIGGTQPFDRTSPYRHMPLGNKFLLILDGADHAAIGPSEYLTPKRTDIEYHKIIDEAAGYFLDTYLKEDKMAREALYFDWAEKLSPNHHFEHQ